MLRVTLALTLLLVAVAASARPLTPAEFALVDRVTWGANAGDAARFTAMGRERWLAAQLRPPAGDALPATVAAQVAAMPISRVDMPAEVATLESGYAKAKLSRNPHEAAMLLGGYQSRLSELGDATLQRALLRAVYSPAQLREQMSWFWFNHFNVLSWNVPLRAMIADYEDRAIRPHALGRFRDLLEATLRHPAILRYLSNESNTATTLNENYARELLELHTMGVGSGYTQADVQALARILTGVGFTTLADPPKLTRGGIRDRLFQFDPAAHDFGDKLLLGHKIVGSGYGEVGQALDILAREPATATRVATRLAQFFVADVPPPALVKRLAARFTATDGDIAAVLAALFDAPEFAASTATRFKDPVHYTLGAMRLVLEARPVATMQPAANWLNLQGEGLYVRVTPDGYPLAEGEWNGSGQLTMRFGMAGAIATARELQPVGELPPLRHRIAAAGLFPNLSPATRSALAEAQGDAEWTQLLLSSPEFMRR